MWLPKNQSSNPLNGGKMRRDLLENGQAIHEFDWEGNNAAITCPLCDKVYVVSAMMHPTGRKCPGCENSTGHIKGDRKSGGTAYVEWKRSN
jgi:hypothetical protein